MSETWLFREGQRVFHCNMGNGTVTSVDGGAVRVVYDDAQPPRKDGAPTVGIYDDAWFRRCGHLLAALPQPQEDTGDE